MSVQFQGATQLASGQAKTGADLVRAAIAARSGLTARQIADTQARFNVLVVVEGFVRPAADIYMADAWKDVLNGSVVAANTYVAGDFTAVPGGGEPLPADLSRHFNNGVDLGSRVFFQDSGVAVTLYFDLIIQ